MIDIGQYCHDKDKATKGVWVNILGVDFLLASSSTANPRYAAEVRKRCKPFLTKIQYGSMDEATSKRLEREAFCASVILDWKPFKINGEVWEYSQDNAMKLMYICTDMAELIEKESKNTSNFTAIKDELKNSEATSSGDVSTQTQSA